MSEPTSTPQKEGGLKQPAQETPDAALSKTGGGETRTINGDEPEGGMIGEGETGGASDSDD